MGELQWPVARPEYIRGKSGPPVFRISEEHLPGQRTSEHLPGQTVKDDIKEADITRVDVTLEPAGGV